MAREGYLAGLGTARHQTSEIASGKEGGKGGEHDEKRVDYLATREEIQQNMARKSTLVGGSTASREERKPFGRKGVSREQNTCGEQSSQTTNDGEI